MLGALQEFMRSGVFYENPKSSSELLISFEFVSQFLASEAEDLHIEFLGLLRSIHDETKPCAGVLAHQLVDHAVCGDLIENLDAEQTARPRVHGGSLQHLRHHLAEALEPRDLGVRTAIAVQLQNPVPMRIVERPERLLADVDPEKRGLRKKHPA